MKNPALAFPLVATLALLPAALRAQTEEKTEKKEFEDKLDVPPQPVPQGGPVLVGRPRTTRTTGAVRPRGLLADTRAVSLKDGEARLQIQGAERVLRPGDLLGSDVVKSVSEGRIVLHRPAEVNPKAGETLVIVEFDAQGQPRVTLFSAKDTKPVPAGPAER